MTQTILILVGLILLEGMMVFLLLRKSQEERKKLKAAWDEVAEAKKELEGLVGLMRKQNQVEGETRDEKEKLEGAEDSELAARADSLFCH